MAGVGAIEVYDLESGRTHISGDGDILDHMVSDRFMAFDLFVRFPSKENELSISRTKASEGPFRPMGQIEQDKEVNKGNDEMLAPSAGLLIRPEGH